jgi:hypothetical protein
MICPLLSKANTRIDEVSEKVYPDLALRKK